MNQLARGRRCALIPATLVAVACGEGGPSSETAQPDRTAEAMAALEANPCDAGSNAALADSTLAALLTGVGHVENEIYDCQRLVMSVGAEGEFGPLVALFPMDGTLGPRAVVIRLAPACGHHLQLGCGSVCCRRGLRRGLSGPGDRSGVPLPVAPERDRHRYRVERCDHGRRALRQRRVSAA